MPTVRPVASTVPADAAIGPVWVPDHLRPGATETAGSGERDLGCEISRPADSVVSVPPLQVAGDQICFGPHFALLWPGEAVCSALETRGILAIHQDGCIGVVPQIQRAGMGETT